MRLRSVVLVAMMLALAGWASAQAKGAMPMATNPATLKYGPLPSIPACATGAAVHGDPMKGEFVLLIKTTSGCTVPMHWHTANEQVGMVSGTGSLAMTKGKPQAMTAGSYIYLPAKNVHSFTCTVGCTFFLAGDAMFDIHYVDKKGKEISFEQATGAAAPAAPAKPAAKPKK
jgi:quercetin dioxygenase-like cupin family protein